MSAFLFAMIAVVLTSLGSRDQWIVAHISARNGQGIPLLVTAWITSIATALFMAWVSQFISGLMPPTAKTMLVAIALLLAAFELAWPVKRNDAKEPTRSLFAIGIVLAARQLGDGPRFLVFAFAVAYATPWSAGLGGAMGGVVAMTIGWLLGDDLGKFLPLRAIRVALAVLTVIMGVVIGLHARGLIG